MKYSIDKADRYAVMQLNEENLNSTKAPKLKSELVILRNEGIRNLILDLTNVKFVDSSGLSAILTANRLWSDAGAFILTGIEHESVQNLITISRLNTILNIIPTVSESIDFIMMEELERELGGEGVDEEDE